VTFRPVRAVLLAMLFAMLFGFAIGTVIRLRLERPIRYIGLEAGGGRWFSSLVASTEREPNY
jgi:hypothetical protein